MTLQLPDPFASVEIGAWMEHGRRYLSWRLMDPGTLHRNRYAIAWFEVKEWEAFRGDRLSFWATRRQTMTAPRESFTDAAREALSHQVLPVIARYGFSQAWTECHAQKAGQAARGHQAAVEEASRVVEWHRLQGELLEAHAAGLVEFRPIGPQDRSVTTVIGHGGRQRQEVSALALLDGERVGLLTRSGDLVPDGSVLDPRPVGTLASSIAPRGDRS